MEKTTREHQHHITFAQTALCAVQTNRITIIKAVVELGRAKCWTRSMGVIAYVSQG